MSAGLWTRPWQDQTKDLVPDQFWTRPLEHYTLSPPH
jgi:hypothetical protein